MKFSIITPNYNGAKFLEDTIRSVLNQRDDVDLEYILVDGGSTDQSVEIIQKYESEFTYCIIEPDTGPANAINKGFKLATGDVVAWLNSDDMYHPGTLAKVQKVMEEDTNASMCFGGCRIIDEKGDEARSAITSFKELFFPISSHFAYQCINYISQPALFFNGDSLRKVGLLREDMVAAWDYELILRLWHEGNAVRVAGEPLSSFRWYEGSISGQNFGVQFKEEYDAAKEDAGLVSLQTFIHFLVRWAIVGMYSGMSALRSVLKSKEWG